MRCWEPLTDTVGLYRTERYTVHEDALRLAEFAAVRSGDRVLDIGTGNGILAIYGNALHGGVWTGIDVDENALALASDSAARNGQIIRFVRMDAADAPESFGHGLFDRVLMNPPYFTAGEQGERALARHGDPSLLDDWLHAAFLLLNNGGTVCLCYPAEKLAALFRALDQNRFAPKRMELLCRGQTARLALVEAKKLGKDGLTVTLS